MTHINLSHINSHAPIITATKPLMHLIHNLFKAHFTKFSCPQSIVNMETQVTY